MRKINLVTIRVKLIITILRWRLHFRQDGAQEPSIDDVVFGLGCGLFQVHIIWIWIHGDNLEFFFLWDLISSTIPDEYEHPWAACCTGTRASPPSPVVHSRIYWVDEDLLSGQGSLHPPSTYCCREFCSSYTPSLSWFCWSILSSPGSEKSDE